MERINKILVPIDLSEISERVLQLACFIAGRYSAELIVILVAEDFSSFSGFAETDLPIAQFEEDILNNSQARLETYLEKHPVGKHAHFQSHVLQGNVAKEILEFSKSNGVDLIIMGTHGYRGLDKMLMGSVTEKVLKLAPCPIMTIR